MKPAPPSRTLTTIAVGFLALDALLLGYAGVALHRASLVIWGAVCAVLAVAVIFGWRRYRRAMEEIAAARREMKREVEAIRDLLHRHHFQN